jgi:hypothetical protein
MLRTFSGGWHRLSREHWKVAVAAAVALGVAAGCGSSVGQENDYTCDGFCNGEPLPEAIIQAPDPATACTEFLESCRGTGKCTSCS